MALTQIEREVLKKLASMAGKARTKSQTPAQLSAIGKKGAKARWKKKRAAQSAAPAAPEAAA